MQKIRAYCPAAKDNKAAFVPPGLIALGLLTAAWFLTAHVLAPAPYVGTAPTGLHALGVDQSHYLAGARAWAQWNLKPALHWYPPGYSLLGAPFLTITPHDPFLVPDLACLLVSQFACAGLARRLFPDNRFAPLLGAGAFLIASIGTVAGALSWVMPWTTTPSATLVLVSLLAVLRLGERPGAHRALVAGSAIGAIALFRPGSAVPVAIAASVAIAPVLLRLPLRRAIWIGAAAVLAASAWVALTVGIIAATSGFGPGTYYALSSAIGFDVGLLPLHWVTFMIDSRPVFNGVHVEQFPVDLHGLCEAFPWIVPGLGGIAAAWTGPRPQRVHVLLVTWLALHLALTLSYRDLHILGFWIFFNYHYFKVTQPIFLLYAVLLLARLADRQTRRMGSIAAASAIVLGFGWRVRLAPRPGHGEPAQQQTVRLPALNRIDDVAIVPGGGKFKAFYFKSETLVIAGRRFHSLTDFRLYPRHGDFLVIPLRPLPRGRGLLTVPPGVHIDPGARASAARQTIVFGLPCAFDLAGSQVCGARTP